MSLFRPQTPDVAIVPQTKFHEFTFRDGNLIPLLVTPSGAGVNTSQTRVQNIVEVFACVRALAEPIGMLDIVVLKATPGGKEFANKHPVNRIVGFSPNAIQTKNAYWERAMYHMVLWGEHFAQIVRNQTGEPISLELIHPTWVTDFTFDDAGNMWWHIGSNGQRIMDVDMIHVPILNNSVRGRSLISLYREDFGHEIAVRDYGSGFFASGGKPNNWLETVDAQITPEQNKKFAENFRAQTGKGGSIMLPFGRKLHAMSLPPEDAQFIQTKAFGVEIMCRLFNVPLPRVQHIKDANFNNLDAIDRTFATSSLMPYTEKFETEYSRKLFTPGELARGHKIEWIYDKMLKADPKTRAEFNRSAIQNGWRTINEVRAVDGLGPVEGGDQPLIQQNMAHLNTIDEINKNRNNGNNNNGNGNGDDKPNEEEGQNENRNEQ